MFQHFGLLDTLTALENVALARALAGEIGPPVAGQRAAELLDARRARRPGLTTARPS